MRIEVTENPAVSMLIKKYPKPVQNKLYFLRSLILESAAEIEAINKIEETLKWGEPSYVVEDGSTIRIDWKQNNPNQYAIYFHCKTNLIDTFKEYYGDIFNFESNRAILFSVTETIPVDALKHCIKLSLTYHKIKHLPMLGL